MNVAMTSLTSTTPSTLTSYWARVVNSCCQTAMTSLTSTVPSGTRSTSPVFRTQFASGYWTVRLLSDVWFSEGRAGMEAERKQPPVGELTPGVLVVFHGMETVSVAPGVREGMVVDATWLVVLL